MNVKPVMTIIDTTIINAINTRSGANVESILKFRTLTFPNAVITLKGPLATVFQFQYLSESLKCQ